MISYRDKTWCPYEGCSQFKTCPWNRALTDEVRRDAQAWWGRPEQAPIAVYAETLSCFTETPIQ